MHDNDKKITALLTSDKRDYSKLFSTFLDVVENDIDGIARHVLSIMKKISTPERNMAALVNLKLAVNHPRFYEKVYPSLVGDMLLTCLSATPADFKVKAMTFCTDVVLPLLTPDVITVCSTPSVDSIFDAANDLGIGADMDNFLIDNWGKLGLLMQKTLFHSDMHSPLWQ